MCRSPFAPVRCVIPAVRRPRRSGVRLLAVFLGLCFPAALPAAPARGILLDFTATWCGPCRQMAPTVDKLERQGWPIRKVDVDREPQLAQKLGVSSIPAFVLVVDGKVIDRVVGATSEQRLVQMLRQIPSPRKDESLIVENETSPSARPLPRSESPGSDLVALGESGPWDRTDDPTPPPAASRRREPSAGTPIRMVAGGNAPAGTAVVRGNAYDEPEAAPTVSPLQASVRLRVKDGQGTTFGSGTVIDSRRGRSIIISCHHVFANLDDNALIHVDVFRGTEFDTYVGRLVIRDEEADLGLVAIPTLEPIAISRIAGAGASPALNDDLVGIGCGGGDAPTHERIQVSALNPYAGPDNIECTGIPQQGRSGGGLFNRRGELVGVCSLSDSKQQRGLYCGLKPIHDMLDGAQLSHLYESSEPQPSRPGLDGSGNGGSGNGGPGNGGFGSGNAPLVADNGAADSRPRRPGTSRDGATESSEHLLSTALAAANGAPAINSEARPMDALQQVFRDSPEAEVICVVRPLGDGQAASRIVILNRASPEFVGYLLDEFDTQTSRRPVSLRVPDEPPVLENVDLRPARRPAIEAAPSAADPNRPAAWGHTPPEGTAPRGPIYDDASAFGAPIRYRRTRS